MSKKVVLTGIKSSGPPHLGNYLGAIRPAIELSKNSDYECFYFIADYHSLNTIQDSTIFQQNIYEVAAVWIALGLNLDQCHLYRQSDIPEIFEMVTILNCFTSKGLMNRAHSYKAAIDKNAEKGKDQDHGINMGLYNYPILMAADILTFNADLVPVGPDQMQHIEMTRDIAQCFNSNYKKEVLSLPEGITQEVGLLPGLDGRKMSSSYNNFIMLFETEKRLRKLVNKIATDSTAPEEPKKTEGSTIFTLYKEFATKNQIAELKDRYEKGISWGEAKAALFEAINDEIKGPREKYQELIEDKSQIDSILEKGKNKVRPRAQELLKQMRATIGLR